MPFWKAIDSDRYVADRLWTSSLSLDLMGRVYSLFKVPFDIHDFGTYQLTTTGSWQDMCTVTVCFPDAWDLDSTFDDMGLRLAIPVRLVVGPSDSLYSIRFKSGSETPATNGTTSWQRDIMTKTYSTIPTGITSETLEHNLTASISAPGTEQGDSTRDDGASFYFGPDCYWEFYQT